jgi:hypothetical protein
MNFVPPKTEPEWGRTDMQVALAELQLLQLAELREIGMSRARALDGRHADEKLPPPVQAGHSFAAVAKAIRQIMALEQETIGLREKRVSRLRVERAAEAKVAVKRSVERSLRAGRPEDKPERRERLLADLFDYRDRRDYLSGNPREIVADICKTLGVEADLSLWDAQAAAEDVHLSAGHDWIVPANGEKPFTWWRSEDGGTVRMPFDSPHLEHRGGAPPDG